MSSKNATDHAGERPWSLAVRLTAYYAASAFLIVALATGFLYWAMVRNVDLEDDHTLADRVRLVQSILHAVPFDESAFRQEVNESWQAGQHTVVFIRVIDPDGATIAESPGMGDILPAALFQAPTVEPAMGSNVELPTNHSYRLMAVGSPQAGVVQVALDRTPEQELLAGYEEGLWYALAAALLVSVLAGFAIAWRGLRPIRQISRMAAQIRPGNLGQRITLTGLPAELHQFAGVFNQMLDRLERAFERLSRFSADIAHELRTPLNNLRGELDVALERRRSPEEYSEMIGSSLEECARLGRIIDSLLFLARAEDPQMQIEREMFDVTEEIDRVREFYEGVSHESGVRIQADSNGSIPVRLNRPLFQRAIGNLVSNALAHTPAGGTITLRARREGDGVAVEVTDTGNGIPAADIPHVCERFYRADRSRTPASGGVGLGLAIVKGIVELHRGSLEISSDTGVGTRVRLVFPLESAMMTKP
jgi:two-component system heavy metal sensor histidine kinase CusS